METPANVVTDESKEATFYSTAVEKAHFRSYNNHIVLVLCGLVIFSISGPGSSSLQDRHVITCRLAIDYDQQMRINVYTFIALISGGLLIAVTSDLTSRLKPLVVSLVFYGLATVALGFCTGYYCFAILSVIRSFWTSALLAVTMVYLAELQTPRSRGPSFCCLQIFWSIGLVVPVFSVPWRTSHFIFGALALVVAGLMIRFLTESPRLLLTLGRKEAAIKSLGRIYRRNFRNRHAEFPVTKLEDDLSLEAQSSIHLRTYVPKALRPPWYSFLVLLQVQFVFNLCYFTMSYWFREIHHRHVLIFPTKLSQKFDCKLGEKYLPAIHEKNDPESSCKSTIDADYYKEVLIVSSATLPILIWMSLRINHYERSYFTTISHVIAGLLSFWVHFLIGTKYALMYTSFMESMLIVSWTASSCLVTEIFGTKFRVLGVALANAFGYVGMMMGLYGLLLIDGASCVFVISMTGILSTAGGLLTLSLPDVVGVHLE